MSALDSKIAEAFQQAAKKLNTSIKIVDNMIILDTPLPEDSSVSDPYEQVKTHLNDCGTSAPPEPNPDPQKQNDEKCSIGGPKLDLDGFTEPSSTSDAIGDTGFKWATAVQGSTNPKCKQYTTAANFKFVKSSGMTKALYHTAKQVKKLIDRLGWSVQVTSWCRPGGHNTCIGGSPTSSHAKGFAVDLRINGGGAKHWEAFKKLIELSEIGVLCHNQIILETKANSGVKSLAGSIIHIDFNPAMTKRFNVSGIVGGVGNFKPVTSVADAKSQLQRLGITSDLS